MEKKNTIKPVYSYLYVLNILNEIIIIILVLTLGDACRQTNFDDIDIRFFFLLQHVFYYPVRFFFFFIIRCTGFFFIGVNLMSVPCFERIIICKQYKKLFVAFSLQIFIFIFF